MTRVMVMPVDTRGCGHYRLLFPAWALQEHGADVVVSMRGPGLWIKDPLERPEPPPGVIYRNARCIGIKTPKPDVDVIVFQRPTVLYKLDAIRHLKSIGIRVVVEVDDLLDSVAKTHAGRAGLARTYAHYEILDEACREADLVTVTTPALADRYGYGHAVVLPNLVPAHYLHIEPDRIPRTVGWSGVVDTHPTDLQSTGGAVGQALAACRGWQFRVVGPGHGVRRALGLPAEPEATGWVSFEEYIAAVGELEVGVVPLADSPFNRAKSCLKAMEMASVGVPPVMSPTPDNLRVHKAGVGLIAESRGQWRRQLERLMRNPDLRAEVAGRGREAMGQFTYEEHCGRWLEAWQSTVREKVAA